MVRSATVRAIGRVVGDVRWIRGPFHHQVIVRVLGLVEVAEGLMKVVGFSCGWSMRLLAWSIARERSRQCRGKER